jgi:hypothetical protein
LFGSFGFAQFAKINHCVVAQNRKRLVEIAFFLLQWFDKLFSKTAFAIVANPNGGLIAGRPAEFAGKDIVFGLGDIDFVDG